MTKEEAEEVQEVEVWRARLVRVWGQQRPIGFPECVMGSGLYSFSYCVAEGIGLRFFIHDPENYVDLRCEKVGCAMDYQGGQVNAFRFWLPSDEPDESGGELDLFTQQWLPFFRRGCWLSGCPIEASAHEKAEWMRGFTREEVEAWNLKI